MSTRIFISILFAFALALNASAQNFFSDAPESSFARVGQKRVIVPLKFRSLKLDTTAALGFLRSLPSEARVTNRNSTPVITIPMPDGTNASFHIWESSTLAPELTLLFPNIKTFTGQGITDPTATIKLDWTENGFHAMILSPVTGTVLIDQYDSDTRQHYIAYYKKDYKKKGPFTEMGPIEYNAALRPAEILAGQCIGTQLRTYRLAVACTGEYAVAVKATGLPSPTLAGTLSAITTTVNRVNGVYEKELSIRLILVATESSVIFLNGATDPFLGNNNAGTLINESQRVIDSAIGSANYDIGHTFSTGGGGLAGLGVVCRANQKARGITGSTFPVGDAYDIDYVAHEMGHQFGGNHTFNSTAGFCSGNGNTVANAEPGSGSTIMAYAGICSADDLQGNSDPQFHAISLNEIGTYSISGSGNNCPVKTSTSNTPPVVNAGTDYTIPASTPFLLTGSATDANGDALTYSWEQIDVGGAAGAPTNPATSGPLFRSFPPVTTPTRYFPKLSSIIGNTSTIGELLPSGSRVMNFRLTARDNKAGGGGVCFDEMTVTSSSAGGPFSMSYPSATGITWQAGEFRTITWNPGATASAPINCSNVTIQLSIDGGLTFPVTILASTPNDGAQEIVVPNNVSTLARIRVMAVGNIFFDLSKNNFSIQNTSGSTFFFNTPSTVSTCGGSTLVNTLSTNGANGFTTSIALTASNVPAGGTITFGTNPVAPGASSTITLGNVASLPAGNYAITITGTAGAVVKTRVVNFIVSTAPVAPAALTLPANNATGVAVLPSFNWSVVSGAASYVLEIASTNSFSTVLQTINNISTLPFQLVTPLQENTAYYWRVKTVNPCGTSDVSTVNVFKTGVTVCVNNTVSNSVPVVISASGAPTVTSTITVPAASGITISDINVVGLNGTHSYIGDLTVSLTSPAGTTVVLFDQICNNEANFALNLDDEAVLTTFPCPPTGNQTVRPENPLSAFDGQSSAGTWTLTVKDNADVDGGSLTGWGLTFGRCSFTATPLVTSPWTQLCPTTASVSLSSNITGATYQWQVNSGSGFTNISNGANYSGATTPTLQLINIPSSWTGYQYSCIVNTGTSDVFTIGFANTWVGSVSTAWETPGNWSCGVVPDQYTDVFVNTGTAIVNSTTAICRSIRVNPNATLTVNTGFQLTVTH